MNENLDVEKKISRAERKKDIKKLTEEGKYFDIYNKYGLGEYNKILYKAMYDEIKEYKGATRARVWGISQRITNFFTFLAMISKSIIVPTAIATEGVKYMIAENAESYKVEIEEYDKQIKEYAKSIKSMKLSDVETFMKVTKDMWGNIDGYGEPKKDIYGYWELDLDNKDGVGVCRNMASDVEKKLNVINPTYNARSIFVYVDDMGDYQFANIDTYYAGEKKSINENDSHPEMQINDEINSNSLNSTEQVNNDISESTTDSNKEIECEEQENTNVDSTENVSNNENSSNLEFKLPIKEFVSLYAGNHVVVLVDIPEDNLTVVLDPTNPGIGVFKNGKIVMLNCTENNMSNISTRLSTTLVKRNNGIENIPDLINDYAKSFEKSKLSPEEIQEKYGLEAQNNALTRIEKKEAWIKSIDVSINNEPIYSSSIDENKRETLENDSMER